MPIVNGYYTKGGQIHKNIIDLLMKLPLCSAHSVNEPPSMPRGVHLS